LNPKRLVPAGALSASEEALIETAIAITTRLDVHQTCAAVLDAAERIYQARSSWLLIHDPGSNELVTVDFRGPDAAAYANARIPLAGGSIVAMVFRDRRPVFVPDVKREDRWFDAQRVHRSSLQTVFTVPLLYEEAPLGVLGLDSPVFSPESPPGPADTARLAAIAAQAAVAIRNAQLFEAVEQDRRRLARLLKERRQLRSEVGYLRAEVSDAHVPSAVIGASPAFTAVIAAVELVARADSTVLLIGETGTGKELIARMIHRNSRRSAYPFVAVNCAALPESLVESELFGYEKGAFTGAVTRTAGKFEMADRGSVLLDEIGDLPAPAQAKLLRVLQEREVQRIGGTKPIPVNVRVIAATNQDLEQHMHRGSFRADLFYRLSVFPIYLPPLRDRREDIPALAASFMARFAAQQHKRPPTIAADVMERLIAYDWPGNVRELQNVIERAVILCRGPEITAELIAIDHAPEHRPPVADGDSERTRVLPREPINVLPFAEAERAAILGALERTGWRISGRGGAAEVLGLKPTTLHAKMKKLGIHRPSLAAAGGGRSV